MYRVADGTEGASFVFALGTGTVSGAGGIVAFSGVDSSVFDVATGTITVANMTGTSTSVHPVAITTVSPNAAVIMLAQSAPSGGSGTIAWSTWTTNSAAVTLAEVYDVQEPTDASVGAAWALKATAGTTGTSSVTVSTSFPGAILLALKPAMATKLAVTSVNGGLPPTVNTAFNVVVQSQQASGTATNVTANTVVTLSRAAGTGTLGGTLTGTILANTSSVTISGVTYNTGESGVSITATRTSGDTLTAGTSATFTVGLPPTITSANNTTFTVGTAGSFTVAATGFPASAFTVTAGTLPSGVTLSSAGVLSGTPAAGTGGTYVITITAANGFLPNATQSFTLTVNQAPAITSAASTIFKESTAGSFQVTSTGFPARTYSETGALPSGVTFTSAGLLSGTPDVGTAGNYPITITASNGVTPDANQSFTLTVGTSPTITSANSTTFTVGTAGSFQVTATGFPAPTFTTSGLPSGVTLSSAGLLSGTPAAGTGNTYNITITAANGATPNGTQSFTLTVNQAPAITSAASTTFTVGTAGSFTVTSTGFPARTFTETGALPSGVTLSSAGVLSGTPDPATGGTYPITITATNGVGTDATQSFTLTVNQAPAFTSAASTAFTVGTAGSFQVTATGFPTSTTFTRTGGATLPSGVTLSSAGLLSGTPAAGTGGTYVFTITANNGVTPNGTQSFTLTVNQSPAFTSANSTIFKEVTAGSFTVTASGVPAPTFSESGPLPSGVTFTPAGVLSGTPDAGTSGIYPITITASNGVTPDAIQSFTLTVGTAPAITSANSTTFTVGTAGSFQVAATGFPAPTFTTSGLPSGVTLSSAGLLSGTPAAGTGNTYNITITATNGVTPNGTQSFTLTVNQAPAITSVNNATFKVGTAGTFTVTSTGFPARTFTETGDLPSGVTLSSAGVLSGTPDAGTSGTYPIIITATNGIGTDATQNFTLTVQQAPAFTSANSTTFKVGTAGSFQVTATGFPASMTFTETGALPSGVTLSSAGVLSGIPAAATGGTYAITITAANGATPNATQSFTLTVQQAPAITSAASTSFNLNAAGTFQAIATGFPAPTFSETGGLPGGVTFSSAGLLSGTPTNSGSFAITITASNTVTPDATQSFTLTVLTQATYVQPFDTNHGWVYTQLTCSGGCSSGSDTGAGNPSPSVFAQTSASLFATRTQTGYFSHQYTWEELGIPAGSVITQVNGRWSTLPDSACTSSAKAGMFIYDTANSTACTASPVEPVIAIDADSTTVFTVKDPTGAVAVNAGCSASNYLVTLRFEIDTGVTAGLGTSTCRVNGDNYTLTINYTPPGSTRRRGQTIIVWNRMPDGSMGNMRSSFHKD